MARALGLALSSLSLWFVACSDPSAVRESPDAGEAVDASGNEPTSPRDASSDSFTVRIEDGGLREDGGLGVDARTQGPPDAGPKGLRDLGDGTVYDPSTKLTWQQSYGSTTYDWPGAKAYCDGLVLAGRKWALPTLDQLRTIVVMERSPSIDSVAFPNTPAKDFWSSTSGRDSAGYADGLSFQDGTWFSALPGDRHYARCLQTP